MHMPGSELFSNSLQHVQAVRMCLGFPVHSGASLCAHDAINKKQATQIYRQYSKNQTHKNTAPNKTKKNNHLCSNQFAAAEVLWNAPWACPDHSGSEFPESYQ
jgi:hypothetical protein